jgi:hypothetical protein
MHVAQRQGRITGTCGEDKLPVMGIPERGKDDKIRVRTSVIENRTKESIQGAVFASTLRMPPLSTLLLRRQLLRQIGH